jgi:dipeptidyl aminopeptidase/acylaminoacyl peptidase
MFVTLACQWSGTRPNPIPTAYSPEFISTVVAMTADAVASPTLRAVNTASMTLPSPTPIVTAPPTIATLAPYEEYTIDYLRKRTYGDGNIEVVEVMEDKDAFTRYLIRYPSDGLTIYGFINVPKGAGPFPVLIALHGYVNEAEYQTLDYTTGLADALTEAGYIVIHPNLRNYPPSDQGDDLFRVGFAVDVLNLIQLVKMQAAHPELLNTAAVDQIGLWGHSLGGNIILRVLTVSADVKAAVLYASISGDETKNAALFATITPSDPQVQTELVTSPVVIQGISPANYYRDITAPVQLYHGTDDAVVPLDWALENCNGLRDAGVNTNCIYYTDEDHTFRRRVQDDFYKTQLEFYRTYLSP